MLVMKVSDLSSLLQIYVNRCKLYSLTCPCLRDLNIYIYVISLLLTFFLLLAGSGCVWRQTWTPALMWELCSWSCYMWGIWGSLRGRIYCPENKLQRKSYRSCKASGLGFPSLIMGRVAHVCLSSPIPTLKLQIHTQHPFLLCCQQGTCFCEHWCASGPISLFHQFMLQCLATNQILLYCLTEALCINKLL